MGELQLLLDLQQIEANLERLQKMIKNLPVFEEFKQLQAQAADSKEAVGWADGKLEEHKKRTRRLEHKLQSTEEEHRALQESLYAGSGHSAKELEQLGRKAEALLEERQKQEETILLAMQGTEDLENAMEKTKKEYQIMQKKLRQKQKSGNEEINRLKEEIRTLRVQRDEILQQVSEPLLGEFRDMQKRYDGRALASVNKDICGGCRVSVSSTVKAQLYHPNCKVYCDNCGRLLVP